MGDWRVPALPNKRFEPTPRAHMLTPEVIERGSSATHWAASPIIKKPLTGCSKRETMSTTTYQTEIRVSGGFYTIKAAFNHDRLSLEYHSSYIGGEIKDFMVECSYEKFSSYHGWIRILSIKDKSEQVLYSWEEDEDKKEGGIGILFEYFLFSESQVHLINDIVVEEMRSMSSASCNPKFELLIMGFRCYTFTDAKYRELLHALENSKFAKIED